MVARFQQIYCVQQTYRGFIAALSGEYWARLWPKLRLPPELYRVTCLSRLIALPKSDGASIALAVLRDIYGNPSRLVSLQ